MEVSGGGGGGGVRDREEPGEERRVVVEGLRGNKQDVHAEECSFSGWRSS